MDRYTEGMPILKCGWTRFDSDDGQRESNSGIMEENVQPLQRNSVRSNMVERFYNNEDDEQFSFEDDTFEDEYEETEGDAIAYVDSDDLISMMNMEIAQSELSHHLLSKAIEIAKQSFFWSFRSTATKMKEIKKIYQDLIEMTEE